MPGMLSGWRSTAGCGPGARRSGSTKVSRAVAQLAGRGREKLELESRNQIADLEPIRSEAFVINYQRAEDVRKLLTDPQQRLLSKPGSATFDPRTNQLFVQDTAARLEEVRRLIARIDVAVPQVLIESRIVEADDRFGRLALGLRGLGGGRRHREERRGKEDEQMEFHGCGAREDFDQVPLSV